MIVNVGIVLRVVGEKLVIFARRHTSDLVAVVGNAAVGLAVNVGIAAGTRQQVQAAVAVAANVWAVLRCGMDALSLAQVAGPNQPDAAEIGVE